MVFVGVDGGGSKTCFICIDKERNVLASSSGGSTNHNSVGAETAFKVFREGVCEVLKNSNRRPEDVSGICLGMSGVDRESDIAMVKNWVLETFRLISPSYQFDAAKILVHNDAVIALASGTGGVLHGAVLISGTGMIALGFNSATNSNCRVGGWGPLLGDEGSGYDVGSQVLKAVVSAVDKRGEETQLVAAVLQALKLTKADDIIGWVYKDQSWDKVAALYPLAEEAYRNNDTVAVKIIERAVDQLELTLGVAIKRLELDKSSQFPIVLAGGVLTHENSVISKLLQTRLQNKYPAATITFPTLSPQFAAASLASNA